MPATVSDPVRPLRSRVERVLDEHLQRQRAVLGAQSPDLLPLIDAATDLLAGGKRLRPAFCYWGWRGAGAADEEAIVKAAASLEFFQAAALIHDDLIDGSDTRRGMPSVHRRFAGVHEQNRWLGAPSRFGDAAAVLLGDLCLGWSDELLNMCGLSDTALRRGRPVFDRMRTELIGGQFLDVLEQVSGALNPAGQAARARRVITHKSARYSVEHPLLLGASLAGASGRLMASYSAYGLPLGEAFQLRDDVLGVFGDPEQTGKPAEDDLREGKRTLLVAFALERASAAQVEAVETLLGDPLLDGAGVEELRRIIVETGALERVEVLVDDLVASAVAALADAPVADDAREPLAELIIAATVRVR
ncbi:MAG TPA: polyprenyl synthetase family protein [Jiangellaceae bacterium]|nr:polyprenyl synthetase family protein [Jiangellaceae bacterium]